LACVLVSSSVAAQQTPPPPQTPPPMKPVMAPPPAPATPQPMGPPQTPPPPAAPNTRIDGHPMPSQNVRVEVTITDTFGTSPVRKSISMVMGDTRSGRIRSSLNVAVPEKGDSQAYRSIGINVDATPEVRPDGRIFLNLTVQYTPEGPYVALGSTQTKPADIN